MSAQPIPTDVTPAAQNACCGPDGCPPVASAAITPPTDEALKAMVRDKYRQIALQSQDTNEGSCCGAGGCDTVDYAVFAESYDALPGYDPAANLGLGCGLPTEFAHIHPGDTVLDLGSGAGNDCFVARELTGPEGRVIGVDMTDTMVEKARRNAQQREFNNVEFRLGELEHLPLADNAVDVVVSNCVLNLVPNKARAFAETFRVLRPGGHFSISDVVLQGQLPAGLQQAAEMYAGCVSGAIGQQDYLALIQQAGFVNVVVQKSRAIQLPPEILQKYLSEGELHQYQRQEAGIFSVTVYGEKPA